MCNHRQVLLQTNIPLGSTDHDPGIPRLIPFNTNAGYGVGRGFKILKELSPNSEVLGGFEKKGGVERDGVLLVIKDEKEKKVEEEI